MGEAAGKSAVGAHRAAAVVRPLREVGGDELSDTANDTYGDEMV